MIKSIGFVGVGIMGKPMVLNLIKAGFEVSVYARTKAKVDDVIKEGAMFCNSIRECAKGKDAVITMVGFPEDVREVYFKDDGILNSAEEGTYLIDMTTTSPTLDKEIAWEAEKRHMHALDAPVTGGDFGAKTGTLSILVGGKKEEYEYCRPVFEAMGKTIVYFGESGKGQHAKLANQIVIAGTLCSVCEAMSYAENEGIELHTLFAAISDGAAGSTQMKKVASLALDENYNPGFFIKHFVKDMKLAQGEAEKVNQKLPVLEKVLDMYQKLEKEGKGNLGTQALIQYYRDKKRSDME
ncbi:2-hydroxy-3-oxopropionate reductase [uncultured Clostridium sp.]|nr:NAD(P)-dependent oxidoreductase [Mediterraneibacter massiliensis]SCI30293.1 2-hydroxy-3-oxopropionate reductase [uncultured Clostridium sp.]